jgi:hypothetical protein
MRVLGSTVEKGRLFKGFHPLDQGDSIKNGTFARNSKGERQKPIGPVFCLGKITEHFGLKRGEIDPRLIRCRILVGKGLGRDWEGIGKGLGRVGVMRVSLSVLGP